MMDPLSSSRSTLFPRRTKRACDPCRSRKTKCDGESECRSCLDIGLNCSYGSRIRRGTGPKYVAYLEQRVKDLEGQAEGGSSDSSSLGEATLAQWNTRMSSSDLTIPAPPEAPPVVAEPNNWDINTPEALTSADKLDNMAAQSLGHSRYDSHSGKDVMPVYRGKMSGLESLRNLRRLCGATGEATGSPDDLALDMVNALDSSLDSSLASHSLPLALRVDTWFSSEAQIRGWIDIAFTDSFTLWPFIDRETFTTQAHHLFRHGKRTGDNSLHDDWGLLHAVIALGQRNDPELISEGVNGLSTGEIRGLEHFEAARDLVPVTQCSRSLTAVQTVLCMSLYVKSMQAPRMAHAFISMAGHAAHQLGLHQAASATHLPERMRITSQRVYSTLKTFDTYVTCSLGLPRNIRSVRPSRDSTDALFIASPEMLSAANANLELLEIMGSAIERMHFDDTAAEEEHATTIELGPSGNLSRELLQWDLKHPIFARMADNDAAANHTECHTKSELFLGYSRCFVHMMIYSPFMQDIANSPWQARKPDAYACGSKCIESAIQAVRIARALDARGMLNEAYPLTVEILVIAATTLLVVELRAPEEFFGEVPRRTSQSAQTLLEGLAKQSRAAAQCLESLSPLYRDVASPAALGGGLREQQMHDLNLSTTDFSQDRTLDFQLFPDSQLRRPDLDNFLANLPTDFTRDPGLQTLYPRWEYEDYARPAVAPNHCRSVG